MLHVNDPFLLRQEINRLKDLLDEKDEYIQQLQKALKPPEWEPPVEIGLTKQEARILASLYKAKGNLVSKENLHYALYHDSADQAEIKIIDVYVCKLRKKVNDYGLSIITDYGRGFHLDTESLSILNEWGIDPQEATVSSVYTSC